MPLALAASFDPASGRRRWRDVGAAEARADGIAWVFSPMVDIARDPRWGRIVESAGEDPYLGSAMARAWVKGYQQDDLSKPDSVAASVKHFAAYGAAIAGRDYNAVDMSEITLRQVYLEPYRAAVEAGAATLMSSFNSINGVPATANPFTLTQILRKEWGFDGFVVSDWGAVAELINHSIGDGPTVARKALEAGVDMDMEGNLYGTVIAAQVRAGKIPESVVDEAVRRILRVKFALGLFDHPYTAGGAGVRCDAGTPRGGAQGGRGDVCAAQERSGGGRGSAAAADRESEESGADWAAGRQPAAKCWARGPVTGDPKYVVTLRAGARRAAGRSAALCAGLRAALRRRCKCAEASRRLRPDRGCDDHSPFRTMPRPSPRRWRRLRKPTWRFWRWAKTATGWKARPRAARIWALPARRNNCWRQWRPPASR